MGFPQMNTAHFRARVRLFASVLAATALMLTGLVTSPASAAGVTTVTKQLDDTQNAGFTAPDTFVTGALVRYRITATCSSNTTDCGVVTISDALAAGLDFVEVIRPAGLIPSSASYASSTRTVTIKAGNATTPMPDGGQMEFILVARVGSGFAGGTIPNTSTITNTTDPGTLNTSQTVTIKVPAPVPNWSINKFANTPSTIATGETVQFGISFIGTNMNNVNITGGTLVDTFPAGAIVVDAQGGVVDYTNHTITWTVDPQDARSGQYYCTTTCVRYIKFPTLRFPADLFPAGTYTNYAQANFNYSDGSSGVLNDSQSITTMDAAPHLKVEKYGPGTLGDFGRFRWDFRVTNDGNTNLSNVVAIDALPTTGFSDATVAVDYGNGGQVINLSYQAADGTWVNLNPCNPGGGGSCPAQPVPAGATHIKVTTAVLAIGKTIQIGIRAIAHGTPGDTMQNCVTGGATGLADAQACTTAKFIEPTVMLMPTKEHLLFPIGTTATSVKPGDEFDFGLMYFGGSPGVAVHSLNVVDVLPKSFEYVSTECHAVYGAAYTTENAAAAYSQGGCTTGDGNLPGAPPEPTVINNPDGTTTLKWNFTDDTDAGFPELLHYLFIKVRVREGTSTQSWTNNLYTSTDEMKYTCSTSYSVKAVTDVNDLDGDGNTTEVLCNAADSIIVDKLAQADVYKWVRGNLDENVLEASGLPDASCPDWDGYTRFPCVSTLTPGGSFDYRFKMINTGNVTLTDYVMYDILPHIGDTGVNQALANSARNTDWTPVLTGPIVLDGAAPAGAAPEVMYNLTWNPCRPELNSATPGVTWQANCDDTWYTQAQIEAMAGGWANVKSFKVTYFQGKDAAWAGGDSFVMRAPMVAPNNAPTSTQSPLDLSVAWNSVGHQGYVLNSDGTTRFLPAAAPRKVGVIVPFTLPDMISIGDYVWLDNNRDGVQGDKASEPPVEGVKVDLKDASGVVIGTTQTDVNGYYSFNNLLTSTDYTVVFTAPDGYSWTQQNAGSDDAADSDVDPATGKVAVTTRATAGDNLLDPADMPTYDGGLVKYNLSLTKDLGTASPYYPGQTVTYTLTPHNDGPSTALAGWSVTDVLPAGLELVSMSGTGYTCTDNTCVADGTLAPNSDGAVITVKAKILASATGAQKNVAYVSPSGKDVFETNPLAVPDLTTDTTTTKTDNDAQAQLTPSAPVAVGDYVWIDKNLDGIQDSTDVPVEGATLSIKKADGSAVTDIFGNAVTTTQTDANGKYLFDNLPAGQYVVTFVSLPSTLPGYVPTITGAGTSSTDSSTTSATSADLAAGEKDLTLDFGFVQNLVSIGDYVWWDTNRDGLQTKGEDPVEGVKVELKKADGTTVGTTFTNGDGFYSFTGLKPDTNYTLVFTAPDGTVWTTQDAGDNIADSDVDPATGEVAVTTPTSGENSADNPDDSSYDGGLVKFNLKLAKTINGNGPFAPGKTVTFTLTPHNDGPVDALAGWSVTEVVPDGLTFVSMTGDGYTCTDLTCVATKGLASGADGAEITVTFTIDAGTTGGIRNIAYVSPSPKDIDETNPLVEPTKDTDTTTTKTDNDAEAPLTVPLVSIGDYVWFDTNRDGQQAKGEDPVADVKVVLKDAAGNLVGTTYTDVDGFYSFVNLVPNTDYTLVFTAPDGSTWTTQDAGANSTDSDVDPGNGKVAVHTPDSGSNSVAAPDDATYDGGLIKYNLVLAKELSTDGPYYSGQTIEFTLTPSNEGPVDALAGWSVTDILPAGLTLVKMSGNGYTCDGDTCTADAALGAGKTGAPITVKATINSDFTGKAKNVAYVSPSGKDAVETNPLDKPTTDTDTVESKTDNDAEAPLTVQKPVRLGDYVWIDKNRDGLQDGSDIPVKGATLTLTDTAGNPVKDIFGNDVAPTTTDGSGWYIFENLPEGTYTVKIDPSTASALDGYKPTTAGAGEDRAKDSSTGSATSVELTSAGTSEDLTLDFGFVSPMVSVSNYVWYDANHDGLQDAGETGLPDVKLTLIGPDGQEVKDVMGDMCAPIKTDANGLYVFDHLPVLPEGQSYTVMIDPSSLPAGYAPTIKHAGDDRSVDSDKGSATSWMPLMVDGAADPTLDFGYWKPSPAIDIVKMDIRGHDANTAKDAVTLRNGSTELEFTVTNTGDEALVDVAVSDQVIKVGKVKHLECTFPDASTGTSWAGPLEVGASFTCTADLVGVTALHKDIASVTGTGQESGTTVSDEDPYWAKPAAKDLPETGAASWLDSLVLAGGLLILAGGVMLLASRRRRVV